MGALPNKNSVFSLVGGLVSETKTVDLEDKWCVTTNQTRCLLISI